MQVVGAVRLVPRGAVYRQIFEDEVLLVHSLNAARSKAGFPTQSEKLSLLKASDISTDARLLLCYQQKWVEKTPCNDPTETLLPNREATFQKVWKNAEEKAAEEVGSLPDVVAPEETGSNILELLSERRRGRHDEALTSMRQELASIAKEMEPFVLEPGKSLLAKRMESDRKIELLFKKIEVDTALEGLSMEGLEELWNIIHQESLTRKKWIREMDESLQKAEWCRADKITDVLRKYTVKLEEISFFLSPDVYRLMNNEAMMINRALLANQRAVAQLFSNLMKSELQWELSHRFNWQDKVKDWKLIQKNRVVHSFREFMANEDIQNPPAVKTEMDNMITDQFLLSGRRMEFLQHLSDLLPPGHTKAEINECYNSLVNLSKSIDSCHMQRMTKIHIQCGMTQQKCLAEVELCQNNLLNLSVCTKNEAEEIVNSELLPLTEKLKSRFEEELEQMSRDFEELAKKNERNCTDLYSYLQEAMDLWDVHQTKLSQQEGEFQKTLKGCRWKQLKSIQKMEDQLDVILAQLRTASAEDKLKKCFENSLSTLNDIRAGYETLHQILMDKVAAYPEDILQKLISYSKSISQYFNVKEIFTQNLQGEIEFTFQDQEAESLEQQAEGIMQENKGEGKMKSSKQAKGETNTKKNEAEIAQGTKETKEKKDGESIPHGSEKPKLARQGAVVKSSKVKSSEIVPETFSTSGGHTYTVLGLEETGKADIPKTFLSKHQQKESLPRYLKHVVIEDTLFVELKKRIRLCFFEHLEKWFAESLSKSLVVVAAKKEKLNSDHELHLHGLQQRQENIETNIYNVRAVELLLHKECLECQSAEVAKALKKEKAEFQKFCQQQDNISKKLQSHICDMESVFLNAPMTEKLVSFNNNLHSELQNHLEMIQVSLRSYRNYLEEALGKLRVSNVDFLKGCRLFSEGGNFSPEEVKLFSRRLQEESKSIGAFERSVKTDMEKMESRCLEQATELINQAETKFHHLFMNRVFMEKSQRLLKNLQVQIRSEVAKSNLQAVTLNSCLKKLHEKIDACAHPTADKEALTAEELYDFAKVVSKELKKRSQYLDCLLVKEVSPHDNEDFTTLETDERLQSPIPVATPTKQLREESKGLVMGLDPGKFPLINPSRTGKSALDDLSIRVIQNLLQIKPPKKFSSLSQRSYHRRSLGPAFPTSKRSSRPKASFEDARKASAAKITKKSSLNKEMPKRRVKKLSVTVVSDKRFQIFEEEPPESDTFKGIIMNILWTGNNSLLSLAEEFYQEAEPQIMMPEDLPETLDDCAELLKQTLLLYQSQTDEYYNSCLTEFQDQVMLFEKEFPSVSQLAFERLLKEHKEKLSSSITQIRNRFNKQLEGWESVKAAHKNQLHPSLGHPDNLLQLDALCQEEIKRQKDQADGVHLYTQMLQDCAAECAQNFVSALAAFTENLLLELDESVTVDDIQPAKTDRPREKAPSLIHQKEAELPLEVCEVKELTERGSRTWPGIPMTTSTDNSDYIICKETASVTTAKTTLGHVAAVEARDAVYKRYKCNLEQQLAQMQEESRAQLLTVQRWEGWWKRSVQKIKQHYT